MNFDDILKQTLTLLYRQGRVSYRALKRRFDLDDDYLEDLKGEIFFAYSQVVDEKGRGLAWTGGSPPLETEACRGTEAERRFHALLPGVIGLLQRERRVTYRTLKYVFGLDDAFLNEVCQELLFKQVARDEQGEGLVWTGEAPSVIPPRWPSHASRPPQRPRQVRLLLHPPYLHLSLRRIRDPTG